MNIKSLASSSAGNCYLIDDGKSRLLLDCGISIKKIKGGADFNFSNISGCLCTHQHL